MEPLCYLCGCAKLRHDAADTMAQVRHIAKRLEELALLRSNNDDLRSVVETNMSTESDMLAKEKDRYIQLLQRKELLLHKVHKVKDIVRHGNRDFAELSGNSQQLRHSNEAKQNTLALTSSVHTSLVKSLDDRIKVLWTHRMRSAIDVFTMMRIDAQPPERNRPETGAHLPIKLSVVGCSSILSVPLPNSGDYSGTPTSVVAMALAHIAHLVDSLSAMLNIPLPHPLLPFQATDCLVSAQHDLKARAQVPGCCYSLNPAKQSNSSRTLFKDFDWTTFSELRSESGKKAEQNAPTLGAPSLPTATQAHTVAVKANAYGEPREYMVNSTFPAALVLLQADVIALCVRAGLSAATLWPAEAMLLNLHLLQLHCEEKVSQEQNFLSTVQDVHLIEEPDEGEGDSSLQKWHREETLRSLRDRYGSQATTETLDVRDRVYLPGEGGSPLRADFSPERSELAREEEWNIIHMA